MGDFDFAGLTLDDGDPDDGMSLTFDSGMRLSLDENDQDGQGGDRYDYNGEELQVEKESKEEISELLAGFKQRAQRENDRVVEVQDSEYWFCVCFQTRAQKDEFLEKAKLMQYGDKYLDGMKVAKTFGIELESPVPPARNTRPFDREFVNIALDIPE